MKQNRHEQIIEGLQHDVNYYKNLYYHTQQTLDILRDDLHIANEKIKSQQRELKRLNNTTKLAEKFARTVVGTALQDYQNKINELEDKLQVFRDKEKYYEDTIDKLTDTRFNGRGNY